MQIAASKTAHNAEIALTGQIQAHQELRLREMEHERKLKEMEIEKAKVVAQLLLAHAAVEFREVLQR